MLTENDVFIENSETKKFAEIFFEALLILKKYIFSWSRPMFISDFLKRSFGPKAVRIMVNTKIWNTELYGFLFHVFYTHSCLSTRTLYCISIMFYVYILKVLRLVLNYWQQAQIVPGISAELWRRNYTQKTSSGIFKGTRHEKEKQVRLFLYLLDHIGLNLDITTLLKFLNF
jgi:hypothetical protein